jgi:hypothetical protein
LSDLQALINLILGKEVFPDVVRCCLFVLQYDCIRFSAAERTLKSTDADVIVSART